MIAAGASRFDQERAVAAAFDAQAFRYDEVWTDSIIGRVQREAVWREIDRLFGRGQRLLDLGCGTGHDAIHLARAGISVCAVDLSPGMLAVGQRRAAAEGLSDMVTFQLCTLERLESLMHSTPFDGAISNFGAFNCVQDLRGLSRPLAALLRPGASLAVCYMGRFCLWELIWCLLRGQPAKAFRRFAGRAARNPQSAVRDSQSTEPASLPSDHSFHVYYPRVRQVVLAFAEDFRLVSFRGVGLLVPPSYVEGVAKFFPTVFKWMARVDRAISGWPLLRAMGDHRLLIFVRN